MNAQIGDYDMDFIILDSWDKMLTSWQGKHGKSWPETQVSVVIYSAEAS